MKKYLIFLLCTLVALPILASDFKYTYQGQTLTYEILDEEAKTCQTKSGTNVGSGNKISGELVIPQTVKNGNVEYSVVSIGNYSFSNSEGLTLLTIPNSVNSIGYEAFAFCSNLKKLHLEDGTEILTCSKRVFTGCPLETIYLGRNLSYNSSKYDETPFYKMASLKNLTISPSVTSIGPYAFSSCKSMTSATIPNSVTTIGEYAFLTCESLTSVTIPNSVTTIGEYAFSSCKSMTSVTLPDKITTIPKHAFSNCCMLSSITIPASVTNIDDYAFYDCTKLSAVSLHEGIVYVGERAFGNTGLTTITLPSTLKTVGQGVFSGSKLSSVNMPDNFFTTIEKKEYAFGGTPYYSKTKDNYEAELKKRSMKKIIGSWTLQIGDRNVAVYTFKSDNTYTAKYTNFLHNASGCYWTFTETGKWSLSKDLIYVTPQTFTKPVVKVSAMANWQQKKMPSVVSQMTPSEYSRFLKEDITWSGNRHVFKLMSDSKMAVKIEHLTSDYDNTWGYLIKNSGSASTASGKKSATTRKKTGKR